LDLKTTYHNKKFERENQHQIENDKPLLCENFQNYESFYAEVYQQMFQSLFRYGMQICGNRDLVKDCIQELFSELWKNQKTLTKIKSIKPYLLKCHKRKIKRELGKGKRLFVEGSFEFEISQELKLIQDDQHLRKQQVLNKALKSLTDRQREAIYLRFYGNLPYEEVAQVLNIKTKATYKLVSRALSSLKTVMTAPI
jgi:RNA polymerase sigma factor (sigma-70 family)